MCITYNISNGIFSLTIFSLAVLKDLYTLAILPFCFNELQLHQDFQKTYSILFMVLL